MNKPALIQTGRVIILTALPVEYAAVRSHLTNIKETVHERGTIYEEGVFQSPGAEWNVAIVEIGAGNSGAAREAERALTHYKPDVALFVGVAGGIKDVKLGDVVAATKVYGYHSGKAMEQFEPRPNVGESSYRLIQRAKAEARKSDWIHRIRSATNEPPPRVLVAPIAAGETVIGSSSSQLYTFLRSQYGDSIAVEMEGRGFIEATHAHNTEALIIRGISDLIDNKDRSDKSGWQEIASDTASAFAFELLSKFTPTLPSQRPTHEVSTAITSTPNSDIPQSGGNPTLSQLSLLTATTIRDGTASPQSSIRALWNAIDKEIDITSPNVSQPETADTAFDTALEKSIELSTAFARVANAVAATDNTKYAEELYKGFEKLAARYYLPKGFSGGFSYREFDFAKLLGHELFVLYFAALLREESWSIIAELLDQSFYVDNTDNGPSMVPFTYLSDAVTILIDRSRRLNRYAHSEHLAVLQTRHNTGPLRDEVSTEEFAQADFLLYLRSLATLNSPDQYWLAWTPWSMPLLKSAPPFLVRAQSKRYANMLAETLRANSIDKLKKIVSRAGTENILQLSPIYINPLRHFSVNSLGSQSP